MKKIIFVVCFVLMFCVGALMLLEKTKNYVEATETRIAKLEEQVYDLKLTTEIIDGGYFVYYNEDAQGVRMGGTEEVRISVKKAVMLILENLGLELSKTKKVEIASKIILKKKDE